MSTATAYDASSIQALSGLAHVRHRPLMYLGSAGMGLAIQPKVRMALRVDHARTRLFALPRPEVAGAAGAGATGAL